MIHNEMMNHYTPKDYIVHHKVTLSVESSRVREGPRLSCRQQSSGFYHLGGVTEATALD